MVVCDVKTVDVVVDVVGGGGVLIQDRIEHCP